MNLLYMWYSHIKLWLVHFIYLFYQYTSWHPADCMNLLQRNIKLLLYLEKQGHINTLSSVRSPDQILAQSSEVRLGKSGGYLSAGSFSNQFTVDNVLRPQPAPVGSMRSNYLSKPYSLAGNSGSPLLRFTTVPHL